MKNIAIFVSGSGTNCEKVIEYLADNQDYKIALVLGNKPDAYALVRAQKHGVATEVLRKPDFMQKDILMPLLQRYNIDFIVLAGFLLVIPDFLIDAYPKRMINLHPALLPKFGGMGMYGHHVHEAVKAAGECETGMTVHYVSPEVDGGQIIAQFKTPIEAADSPDDIAAKEHLLEMAHFAPTVLEILDKTFKG